MAKVINVILFPLCLGGVLGIIEATVLAENVPRILSVNLLDYLGCVIDLPRNDMFCHALDEVVKLTGLGSGHRLVEITQPLKEEAKVPAAALKKHPFLRPDSFLLDNRGPPVMSDDGVVSQC
eukprot:3210378-Pyramimonas_sp.AAC.1